MSGSNTHHALRRQQSIWNTGTAFFAFLLAFTSGTSHAQPGEKAVLAESLFREGRRLMDSGYVSEGCRKLAESQRLEAAAGTLLALAVCHEKEGKLATAWAEFSQSLLIARRDHRPEREAIANEHLAKLDNLLPRVTIDVPAATRVPGLEVLRNATQLTEGAWGVALPCDPGTLVLEARAAGYIAWSTRHDIAPGATVRIEIPVLAKASSTAESPLPPKVRTESARGEPSEVPPIPEGKNRPSNSPNVRHWALPVALVSLAPVVMGAGFGIAAIVEQKHSDEHCPVTAGRRICSAEGIADNERARSFATLSNAGIGVGLVGLAVSAGLFWLGGPDERQAGSKAELPLHFYLAWDGNQATALLVGRY